MDPEKEKLAGENEVKGLKSVLHEEKKKKKSKEQEALKNENGFSKNHSQKHPSPKKGVRIHEIIDNISMASSESEDDAPDGALALANQANAEWDQERQKRETWTGKMDFILSCVGYAVGLGNVWRFPYLCYRSGGGAFLVPYFIFLVLCGMPLVMLEMSMGQFASLSPTALFQKLCPLFQGVGWGMIMVAGVVCIYYNIIITWTIYYLYLSFRAVLPWASCDNPWNTPNCVTGIGDLRAENGTNMSLTTNSSLIASNISSPDLNRTTASEEFWRLFVLQISPGIDQMGSIRWELLLCLALAWLLVFACLFKGVKSSGRVVYVTATFPYLVLIILCIRGLTLPGAFSGVSFYLWPQWHKLAELSVWLDAASQIFYSQGAAWGALITMSSYNRFRHDCYRDAIIIPLINCGTSLFAGIVVFSIIGFMAHEAEMDVGDVITSGPGLAFIVYPEAVTRLPVSPLWAVLFFVMILTVGVDSQFGMFETLISAVVDTWPETFRPKKVLFTGCVCVFMFFLGIPCVMEGGMYALQLMDWYSATFTLMILSMIECIIVAWIYGFRRFMVDISMMIRRRASMWWPICWGFITPIVIFLILVTSMVKHTPVEYNDYEYPSYAIGLGWLLAGVSLVPLPVFAIRNMLRAKGTFRERLEECLQPAPDWGPSRLGDRVAFRKSYSQHPSRQLYVLGVDRQHEDIEILSVNRQSFVDLGKFINSGHHHHHHDHEDGASLEHGGEEMDEYQIEVSTIETELHKPPM